MDLAEILEEIDAPEEIGAWVASGGFDIDGAWDNCERAEHRVWIGACAGFPIQELIDAAAATAWSAIDQLAGLDARIGNAFELAVSGAPTDELVRTAAFCREWAEGAGTYRKPRSPAAPYLASAAALVLEAAEGLAIGEARREAVRLERSRQTGVLIGVGTQIVLPPREGPAQLNVIAAATDPAHGIFLFAIAAIAEALRECTNALEQQGRGDGAAAIDAVFRATLERE